MNGFAGNDYLNEMLQMSSLYVNKTKQIEIPRSFESATNK